MTEIKVSEEVKQRNRELNLTICRMAGGRLSESSYARN